MQKQWFVLPLAAMVLACDGDQPSGDQASVDRSVASPAWEAGPEASSIAIDDGGELGPLPKTIRRCWRESGGYDCIALLQASSENAMMGRYQVERLDERRGSSDAIPEIGYSCQLNGSVLVEHISNGRDYVAENILDLSAPLSGRRPWGRDYVLRFMSDNGIDAAGTYFDCAELSRQIVDASEEVLTATTVRYGWLVEGELEDAFQ